MLTCLYFLETTTTEKDRGQLPPIYVDGTEPKTGIRAERWHVVLCLNYEEGLHATERVSATHLLASFSYWGSNNNNEWQYFDPWAEIYMIAYIDELIFNCHSTSFKWYLFKNRTVLQYKTLTSKHVTYEKNISKDYCNKAHYQSLVSHVTLFNLMLY